VPPIEALRVKAVQISHASRKVWRGRFGEKVVMVAHQTVGVEQPTKTQHCRAHDLQENRSVGVVAKNVFFRVAS